jgi:small-conductance mechanosensitive channel
MSIDFLSSFFANHMMIVRSMLIALIGLSALTVTTRLVKRKSAEVLQPHMQLLLSKLVWYGGLVLIAFMVLSELKVNVSALIGAAGVVGVALGFASQTSIANIISGIFLLVEHPFKVGDFVETEKAAGFVQSIDLLAVQLKTSDGRCVRVPNELLIKTVVTNNTFYKIRRVTIFITIDRRNDISKMIAHTQAFLEQSIVVKQQQTISITIDSVTENRVMVNIEFWVDARKVVSSKSAIVQSLYELYKAEKIDAWIDAAYTQCAFLGAVDYAEKKG